MKIGLQIYHFDWPGSPQNIGSKLKEIATTAEKSGFSSLWVMDHLFQLGGAFGPIDSPVLEAYSTISYLAAVTKKINIGALVTNNARAHLGTNKKADFSQPFHIGDTEQVVPRMHMNVCRYSPVASI